jgi:hypothetical protein
MILIYYCVGDARIARLYAVADGDARIAVSRDASIAVSGVASIAVSRDASIASLQRRREHRVFTVVCCQ